MAIPFAFPSDEDTEANYQRLDQLLSDLFVVLQQILMTQRRIRDAQPLQIAHRIRNGQPVNSRRNGEVSDISSTSAPVFPPPEPPSPPRMLDVDYALQIASTSTTAPATASDRTDLFRLGSSIIESDSDDRNPTRRRRRRRRTSSESSCCDETKNNATNVAPTATTPDWTQVGVNLRKIADDFYASVGKDDSQVQVQTVTVSEESKRPCDPTDVSLLSMLVPPPFGGSIWTAVLFVVGWRLLARAR